MALLHHATSFLLCDEAGDFDAGGDHGFYFENVRCLSRLSLSLEGDPALALTTTMVRGDRCTHYCTNARSDKVRENRLVIRRRRELGEGLKEELVIESFADAPLEIELAITFASDFAPIYQVKQRSLAGSHAIRELAEAAVTSHDRTATLQRQIAATRCLTELVFSRVPRFCGAQAHFTVPLERGRPWSLLLQVRARFERAGEVRVTAAMKEPHGRRDELAQAGPKVESDHPVLAAAYARSASDLVELRIKAEGNPDDSYVLAAGIPWYMALFGRDSLISAYESMLHDASLALGTLHALAALQGRRVDPDTAEEPGRILHEHRPHALTGPQGPRFPYFGTIDATPLWLITLSEYVRCTGDLDTPIALWSHVERALAWIDEYGDRDRDGLIEYQAPPGALLQNEGWKDSDDAIRFADGRQAQPPIALVEVQGYVVEAWRRTAELCGALGRDPGPLRQRASRLQQAIEARFWMESRGSFALALDGDKQRVDALTSNPGHLLWAGAVGPASARRVAATLLGDALFCGWGVRTMARGEGGFDPVSYHNGSVWPHDNALLLQGLARYGLTSAVARLADALLEALAAYPERRFPELFAGFDRAEATRPVAYPNANAPQSWASGAIMLLVRAVLGLEVNALSRRVRVQPAPLSRLSYLRLREVVVGPARFSIEVRFGATPRARVTGLPPGWRMD